MYKVYIITWVHSHLTTFLSAYLQLTKPWVLCVNGFYTLISHCLNWTMKTMLGQSESSKQSYTPSGVLWSHSLWLVQAKWTWFVAMTFSSTNGQLWCKTQNSKQQHEQKNKMAAIIQQPQQEDSHCCNIDKLQILYISCFLKYLK